MAFTVSTVNVNGIRAAVKQRSEDNLGMLPWLENSGCDVVCLQEVRANPDQAFTALEPALAAGWHLILADSVAKGRAGVAILSRTEPAEVAIGFGDDEFADQGRYIEAKYSLDGVSTPVTISSLYLPSGDANTPKQDEKDRFLSSFGAFLRKQAALHNEAGRNMLVCGDWNIAHREADLKNHKNNHKSSGFLPHERDWVSSIVGEGADWVDVVRSLHPDEQGPYSWWSMRGKAFDNNAGWRIDYHVATRPLAARALQARVDRASAWDMRWSDHAPVNVTYS